LTSINIITKQLDNDTSLTDWGSISIHANISRIRRPSILTITISRQTGNRETELITGARGAWVALNRWKIKLIDRSLLFPCCKLSVWCSS